jgi:hypothetical protein
MKKLMAGIAAQGTTPPGVCSSATSHRSQSTLESHVPLAYQSQNGVSASTTSHRSAATMDSQKAIPISPASTNTTAMSPMMGVPVPQSHRVESVQSELAAQSSGMELKPVNWSRQNYTVDTATALAPREESSNSSSDQTSVSQKLGNVDFMRLRYMDAEPNSSPPGTPTPLILIAGFQTYFPARVDITSVKQEAMRNHIEFMVEPALPSGLTLQKSSGLICGIPKEPQDVPSVHRITVSIDATGPGGVSLGALVLTSCIISVRVRDLHSYMLYWVEEKFDTDDGGHILLKLQKC